MGLNEIIQYLMVIVMAFSGWWATRMQKDIDAGNAECASLKKELIALELKVAEKSVSKEDFNKFEERLFKQLTSMDERLRSIPN